MELANGVYKAKAVGGAMGFTSNGNEQIGVQFRLLGEGLEGRYITWRGYFTDKAIDRTIESLRICGWQGNELEDLAGIDTNEVELVVENEEYNGVTTPKVRWVNRSGGLAMSAPMQPEQLRSFSAKMKGAILAYDKRAGTPLPPHNRKAPAAVRVEPPPHTDVDRPPF